MRVVSGAARGLCLETIAEEGLRPTTDRVKESVFNILQFDIQGKKFLDLFGGSGQIGIEAASRGTSEVIIVENNNVSLEIIKKNLLKVKNRFNINLVKSDAIDFLKRFKGSIDIAFLDPPYNSDLLPRAFEYMESVMSDSGIIVTESAINRKYELNIGRFIHKKNYKYGNTQINIYKS